MERVYVYKVAVGRQVRSGRRQSMPSSSIDSYACVSATLPSGLRPEEAAALKPLG